MKRLFSHRRLSPASPVAIVGVQTEDQESQR